MEIEYWWLLALPLFFALGWLAARIDIKHSGSESRALPTSYFKGQFPAQRAAGQGDRGVHRGRQGRAADHRAAFRAGLAVSPPRRGRARNPHASEPGRARRPAATAEVRRAVRARAGLPEGGTARPRGGIIRETQRQSARGGRAQIPARDLRAGKGLAEGHRYRATVGAGDGTIAPEGNCEFLLRDGEPRNHGFAPGRRAASPRARAWRTTGCACAPTCCSAISSSH